MKYLTSGTNVAIKSPEYVQRLFADVSTYVCKPGPCAWAEWYAGHPDEGRVRVPSGMYPMLVHSLCSPDDMLDAVSCA